MAGPVGGQPPFEVSHVILDIDGTLVDFIGALRVALQDMAAGLTELSGTAVEEAELWRAREAVAAEPEWAGRGSTAIRRESFRRILEGLGVPGDETTDRWLERYRRVRRAALAVFPDVGEGLERLRAEGLTLVAASNGDVDLRDVGIREYFTYTYYAREAGVSKPHPHFFAGVLERAGAAAAASLAVGDRLDNDYHPARAAGLHAVLIDRRARVDDPAVLRIETLTELAGLIRAR